MNRGREILIVSIGVLAITFICLWTIDISVSAMLCGMVLTNGFWIARPEKMYHLSLYLIIFLQMINIGLWVLVLFKGGEKDEL